MLCLPPKAAFLTEDFHKSHPPLLSSVVSFNPLILQGVFLLSIQARDVLPSKPKQSEDSSMQSTTVLELGSVFCWCVCVCLSVSVCVCVGGGSYSPSNHLFLQLRKKKKSETKTVCVQECVCVCRIQSLPPPAGFVMAGFPSSYFNP